jgi:hypothetical protein
MSEIERICPSADFVSPPLRRARWLRSIPRRDRWTRGFAGDWTCKRADHDGVSVCCSIMSGIDTPTELELPEREA